MTIAAPSSSPRPRTSAIPRTTLAAATVLGAWFVLVILLAANGAFATPSGSPPLPLLLGVMTPIIWFLGGFRLSHLFRDFVFMADLRFVTAIQSWRFAGFGFLALSAWGVLPGLFAWPAGLGDIAIGVTAPWIATALARRPDFANSKFFNTWNLLGILDLIVAVGTGALSAATGIAGEITASPMAQLPLVLVPVYFVPLFAMLHVAALLQARRRAGSAM